MSKIKLNMVFYPIFGVVLFALLYVYWSNYVWSTFAGIIQTFDVKVHKIDAVQVILGYVQKSEDLSDYLSDSDFMQVISPILLHILGIVVSLSFISIPRDFIKLIIPRIKSPLALYHYLTKKSVLNVILYSCCIILSMVIFLNFQSYLSSMSSFNYQAISVYGGLLRYLVLFILIISTFQKIIYLGFFQRKLERNIFWSVLSLIIIHLLDRKIHSLNIVLFDFTNGLVDSYLFWGIMNIVLLIIINKEGGRLND